MSLQPCPPSTAKHVNNTPDPYSVILLGTGVAGLSAAQRLLSAGHRVALISPDSQCGGFHQNDQIGPYSFDRGSIFYEETSRLFDLAPGLREMCPTVRREQRRVTPNNAILRYPFEASELAAWKKSQMASAVLDLATARLRYQLDGSLDRICHRRLGKAIYRKTGLRDYIKRFNHIDPAQIDESFFFHRMGPIDRETQLKTMMTKAKRAVGIGRVPKKVWPALYVRPAEGYGTMFERVRQTLEADGAQFYMGERPIKIMRDAAGFHVVSEKGTYTADALVSSAPIGTIYKMLTGEDAGLQSL
ncbi:FAD-dependent oxidoreductase, partial [Alloyangia pacifica]|uniref:FAD-dependent oxidoreductase n=1 Tax=Alloyangia pacifica TaxID=311180 RepID=UPI001CD2A5B8